MNDLVRCEVVVACSELACESAESWYSTEAQKINLTVSDKKRSKDSRGGLSCVLGRRDRRPNI